MIIVKFISPQARNILDCLKYIRELKENDYEIIILRDFYFAGTKEIIRREKLHRGQKSMMR